MALLNKCTPIDFYDAQYQQHRFKAGICVISRLAVFYGGELDQFDKRGG